MPAFVPTYRLPAALLTALFVCSCSQPTHPPTEEGRASTRIEALFSSTEFGLGNLNAGMSSPQTLMNSSLGLVDMAFPFPDSGVRAIGRPLRGLTPPQQQAYQRGAALFAKTFSVSEGNGLLFNGSSCSGCHNQGGVGGTGTPLVTRMAVVNQGDANWRFSAAGFDAIAPLGGPVKQRRALLSEGGEIEGGEPLPTQAAIDAYQAQQAALGRAIGRDLITSRRTTTTVAGNGLLSAIPDSALQLRQILPKPFGIRGHLNVQSGSLGDLNLTNRIGRLGLKAQLPDNQAFFADAAVEELGLSNPHNPVENRPNQPALQVATPDISAAQRDDFMAFCVNLAPPRFAAIDTAGQKAFYKAGCAECHYNGYRTTSNPMTLPSHLRPYYNTLGNKPVFAFTDLLVHNMGQENADGFKQGTALGAEWRTAPLWGLGFKTVYWHDNRATSLEQAIMAHQATGSEANGVIQNYLGSGPKAANNLSAAERTSLLAFLSQL